MMINFILIESVLIKSSRKATEETEIWQHCQIVYAQTRICHGECDTHNFLEFSHVNRSPNADQKPRCSDN